MRRRANSALNASLALAATAMPLLGAANYDKPTYDYYVWASTILALYALYRELKARSDAPLASTMLLGIAGGAAVAAGRLASLWANSLSHFGYVGPLVGSEYSPPALHASALVPIGAFWISTATLINAVRGGPITFTKTKARQSLADLAKQIDKTLRGPPGLALATSASFAMALTYRITPEIVYNKFLIGWDTVEYTAHLLDFLDKKQIFTAYYWMGDYRHIPPMLDILLSPLAAALGAWTVFKIYPSVAFAALAAASAALATSISKDWKVGILAGAASTVYILNLRISWDYHRQLLGSLFMVLTVLALEKWGRADAPRKAAAAAALLAATALSHEVTALAATAMALALAYKGLKSRDPYSTAAGAAGLITGAALEIWYWGRPIGYDVHTGTLKLPGVVTGPGQEGAVVSYITAGLGLVLPPALVALSRHRMDYATAATAALLLAAASPLIAPYTSVTTWYRFLIGTAPLLMPLAAVGMAEATKNWKAAALYIAVLALPGHMFTYAYNWQNTYTPALAEFPQRLIPSPIDNNYLKIYQHFKDNPPNATVVAPPHIARYIHLATRNPDPRQLIWTWYTDTWQYACSLNATRLIVVTDKKPQNATCPLQATPLNDYEPTIYYVTK
ncbi:MAG: hypothetical protein QXP31_08855 [Pyrobaculum sp.]